MLQQFLHITNVLNVNNLILEAENLVKMQHNKTKENLTKKNLFAQIVAKSLLKIAQNMVRNILSSNAVFVVQLRSGFVGEILTFVKVVIKNSVKDNISVNYQKTNYQNVKVLVFVQLEAIILEMEIKNQQAVLFVEILNNHTRISDNKMYQ